MHKLKGLHVHLYISYCYSKKEKEENIEICNTKQLCRHHQSNDYMLATHNARSC